MEEERPERTERRHSMKVVVIREFGGPEGLAVVEASSPELHSGQALIRTLAISVGTQDVMIRTGALAAYGFKPGHILGGEIAGEVIAVGDSAHSAYIGQNVWAMVSPGGGYAERVVAPVASLVALQDKISPVQAVTIGGAGIVAHFGLHHAHFCPGESLLVRGASGPIGMMAVLLAGRLGTSTIAVTTSSNERGNRLRELGAGYVLDRAMVGPAGIPEEFDVILDLVGGPDMSLLFRKLKRNGRLISLGAVAGLPPDDFAKAMFPAFQRSLSFATFSAGTVPEPERHTFLRDLFAEASRGSLPSILHGTFPLNEAVEAHRLLESGTALGRIVLVPDNA